MSALTVERLGRRFKDTWAVRDVSFTLERGRVAAVVGQNGAGKSTMMRMIAGLTESTTGSVSAGTVRLVGQTKPVYGHLTAGQMLEFGRRMNPTWDDAVAKGWLAKFSVPLGKRCDRLSGGQRSQVALAVALGARPDLLLLDEPLAELDPVVRAQVVGRLLETVSDGDTTVLLSTHLVSDLHGVADSLLVMADGELLVAGDVDDLIEAHRYVEGPPAGSPPGDGIVVRSRVDDHRARFLVRGGVADLMHPAWTVRSPGLEELILDYLQADRRLEGVAR
jgi:ABC-2 type transport system ATP-binding protein